MIVLFDTPQSRQRLYPLSLTRPIGDLMAGSLTLQQWWASMSEHPVSCISAPNLIITPIPAADTFYCIDATILPTQSLMEQLLSMQPGDVLEDEEGIIAFCSAQAPVFGQLPVWSSGTSQPEVKVQRIHHVTELVSQNHRLIVLTAVYTQLPLAGQLILQQNQVLGHDLYCAPDIQMQACIINTNDGPVIIDEQALIMEGAIIRGPVYIGKGAVVKAGAKIYAGTTIGRGCTVGGEIKQSILHSYSNKAHDGYLGDSYIGAWCNLGAGTSNSNLKNTASEVMVWHQAEKDFRPAGLKAGTIMGDYSRTAINSSINTGTCIGVCCSLHQAGLISGHVPSFSWGNNEKYTLPNALQHIRNWKKLKGCDLSENEIKMLTDVFNQHWA